MSHRARLGSATWPLADGGRELSGFAIQRERNAHTTNGVRGGTLEPQSMRRVFYALRDGADNDIVPTTRLLQFVHVSGRWGRAPHFPAPSLRPAFSGSATNPLPVRAARGAPTTSVSTRLTSARTRPHDECVHGVGCAQHHELARDFGSNTTIAGNRGAGRRPDAEGLRRRLGARTHRRQRAGRADGSSANVSFYNAFLDTAAVPPSGISLVVRVRRQSSARLVSGRGRSRILDGVDRATRHALFERIEGMNGSAPPLQDPGGGNRAGRANEGRWPSQSLTITGPSAGSVTRNPRLWMCRCGEADRGAVRRHAVRCPGLTKTFGGPAALTVPYVSACRAAGREMRQDRCVVALRGRYLVGGHDLASDAIGARALLATACVATLTVRENVDVVARGRCSTRARS